MPTIDNDRERPTAVIVGLDSLQGLQAARVLAERKVSVIAIARDPKYHSCGTRVCQEIVFTNTESDELIGTLRDVGARLSKKGVLYPCQDNNVLLISRHRHQLEEFFHIVLPSPDTVETLMDKAAFYALAQKEGWPTPRTFVLSNRAEADDAARNIEYPCVLKPSTRGPRWLDFTSIKAFKVFQAQEFLDVYDRYHARAELLIVQEWIEGPATEHYTCHGYFDADSEPLVTFTSKKIRQWPPNTGQRCLGQECRNDIVKEQTVRVFDRVNFHGLAYLEMKRDERSGKYLIIEPNIGRPTGSSITAEAAGVDILYTMYCDTVGLPHPRNLEQKYLGVKWIHLLRDLQATWYHWQRGELSLKEWWRSWRGQKTFAILSWRDPAPFLLALRRSLQTILSSRNRQHESKTPLRNAMKPRTSVKFGEVPKP